MRALLLLVVLCLAPRSLPAQSEGAYRDPVARQLVARARQSRGELGRSITSYTALVRNRSAAMLRMPLKDRMLDHSESAARVWWSRDGETAIQVLGSRERDAEAVRVGLDDVPARVFDPTSDRVYFGMPGIGSGEKSLWIAHPLAEGSEEFYSYRSGDTMTVRLQGRTIRAVELHVIPKRPSFHYLTATLWIEPETGALVQAVYRPARSLDMERDTAMIDPEDLEELRYIPGFLKPIEADLESVIVEYSLWELRHWLPRLMRMEGYVRAGALRVPFSEELAYEIEAVRDDSSGTAPPAPLAEMAASSPGVEMQRKVMERDGKRVAVYLPRDTTLRLRGGEIPPPIWDGAPEFASEAELEALVQKLAASVPRPAVTGPAQLDVQWGLGGSDLLRYNRVEGLSAGARAIGRHALGEAQATVRLGTGDLHPNLELAATLPRARRTLGVALYHQLAATDPGALGFGNSASALLFGSDSGEYYRATGVRATLSPPAADRAWYRWTLFAERQRAVERGTTFTAARLLGPSHSLRPNLVADPAELVGAGLLLSPWWGRDPLAPAGGLDYLAEAATGDRHFARSRLVGHATFPLGPRHRLGLESGVGTSGGSTPAQYLWFLGGSETLRGYAPSTLVGTSFVRGRAELAQATTSVGLALFGDAGWAGERSAFRESALLYSVGVGASFLDGLVRIDVARGLRKPTGWRAELYLDALL